MRTRTFCLLLWGLIVALNVAAYIVARSHPWGGLVAGGFGAWDAVEPPADHVPTLAERVLDWKSGAPMYASDEFDPDKHALEMARLTKKDWHEWLATYEELKADSAGVRRLLVRSLIETLACVNERVTEDDDARARAQWAEYRAILEGPATAQLTAMQTARPDDALWSFLELRCHLSRAVKANPDYGVVDGDPYSICDEAALERARQVARGHKSWGKINTDWRREWNLRTEYYLVTHPKTPEAVARVITGTLSFYLSAFKPNVDACMYLGDEALKRRDFEEARLWYETVLAMCDSLVVPDNTIYMLFLVELGLWEGLRGMRDWHLMQGHLKAGREYAFWQQGIRHDYGEAAVFDRTHDDPLLAFGPRGVYAAMYRWCMLIMMAVVATYACLAAWFGLLIWLGLLTAAHRQGKDERPSPPVRWRAVDSLWSAGCGLVPYCVLAVVLLYLAPENRGWALDDRFGLQGLVPFAAFVPFVVGFWAARRAWSRLQAEGRTAPPFSILVGLFAIVPVALFLILYESAAPFGQRDALVVVGAAVGTPLLLSIALFIRALVRKTPAIDDRIARTSWLLRALIVAAFALNLTAVILWRPATRSVRDYWETKAAALADRTRLQIGDEQTLDVIFRPLGYDPPNATPPRGNPAESPTSIPAVENTRTMPSGAAVQ